MKVKLILPALISCQSPFWSAIKYSLWPPLGLATLAGYLRDEDEVALQDENVETLDLDDEPDLVGIQVYVSSTAPRLRDRRSLPEEGSTRSRWAASTSPRFRRRPANTQTRSS